MKKNYQAWEIELGSFPETGNAHDQLKFLLRFGALAPSSHNSQPWNFKIHDGVIEILVEEQRSLPESDANHRQLYISIGCAIKNILIAANFFGFETNIEYATNGQERVAARILIQKGHAKQDSDSLIRAILTRHSNRNKYEPRSLPVNFIDALKRFSNEYVTIFIVDDSAQKNIIADIVVDAGVEAMESDSFRKELSAYIRTNYTIAPTGMPMFGWGMPGPLSLLAPAALKHFNMNKLSASQDRALLKDYTPAFLILATKKDDVDAWMQVGGVFEEIALTAECAGIRMSPLAAPIQIGTHYQRLQEALSTDLRPQFFARAGFCSTVTPHSPRFSVDDLLR